MDEAFRVLAGLVRTAAREAGVPAARPDRRAHLGLPGRGRPARRGSSSSPTWCTPRAGRDPAWWSTTRSRCCGRAWTTRAAHWGVGVTCGAGINCVGVAPGRARRPGSCRSARSAVTGAAAATLAGEALWWAVQGRGRPRARTPSCATAVPAHFGLATVRDVTIGCYREQDQPPRPARAGAGAVRGRASTATRWPADLLRAPGRRDRHHGRHGGPAARPDPARAMPVVARRQHRDHPRTRC